MNNLQLIKSANFGNVTCDIYGNNDDFFMTREQIGRALEYADANGAIEVIHRRNKDRLDKYSSTVKMTGVDGKARSQTVYTRKGVMEICRHSQQPKADKFMDWVWDVMDGLITGRTQNIPTAEIERMRVQSQADRAKAMLMNAQNRMLKTVLGTVAGKALSPVAVEAFTLKSIEAATGISMSQYLPECKETHSATDIGLRLGITPHHVGSLANKHGLKTDEYGITVMDKSPHSAKEVPNFRYYANVIPALQKILKERI